MRKKAVMTEKKKCKTCKEVKSTSDFYAYKGVTRPDCKSCTIKKNGIRQRLTRSWLTRGGDVESRKQYYRDYYHNNPDKQAQYRENFKITHPDYQKEYYQKRRDNGYYKKRRGMDSSSH